MACSETRATWRVRLLAVPGAGADLATGGCGTIVSSELAIGERCRGPPWKASFL